MFYFHCTQKLLKVLDLPIQQLPKEPDSSPMLVWYANIIEINNLVLLLFVNDPTLYTVILPFPGRPDSAQVSKIFINNLTKSLFSDGITQPRIQRLLDELQNSVFIKTTSRSMIGSMNDLIDICRIFINQATVDKNKIHLYEIQNDLNRMPQRKIGWKYSVDAMRESIQD